MRFLSDKNISDRPAKTKLYFAEKITAAAEYYKANGQSFTGLGGENNTLYNWLKINKDKVEIRKKLLAAGILAEALDKIRTHNDIVVKNITAAAEYYEANGQNFAGLWEKHNDIYSWLLRNKDKAAIREKLLAAGMSTETLDKIGSIHRSTPEEKITAVVEYYNVNDQSFAGLSGKNGVLYNWLLRNKDKAAIREKLLAAGMSTETLDKIGSIHRHIHRSTPEEKITAAAEYYKANGQSFTRLSRKNRILYSWLLRNKDKEERRKKLLTAGISAEALDKMRTHNDIVVKNITAATEYYEANGQNFTELRAKNVALYCWLKINKDKVEIRKKLLAAGILAEALDKIGGYNTIIL
ncbi:MAG: hypothetical protein LBQ83_08165 [Candidatus Margulisbacteria bacterium]|jgi:hypothetical protein|nr:hypothetical protein [Candidatus Margulisiibacteriota bacterium]